MYNITKSPWVPKGSRQLKGRVIFPILPIIRFWSLICNLGCLSLITGVLVSSKIQPMVIRYTWSPYKYSPLRYSWVHKVYGCVYLHALLYYI